MKLGYGGLLSLGFLILLLPTLILGQTGDGTNRHTIYSKSIGENRLIFVSTPADYKKYPERRYPVLYVLDGEWVFDYADSSVRYLSDFAGRIPQMIVVGVPNTDRGRDLFVTLDAKAGYNKFLKFFGEELVPYVNGKYRTNGFNMIYGYSSGTGICRQFLAESPHLFDAYIESGSAIGRRTAEYLSQHLPKHDYKNKYLYASTEGIGPRVAAFKRYQDLMDRLDPNGVSKKFEVLEGQTHAEVLSSGLYLGLNFVFYHYAVPDAVIEKGADAIVAYFDEIDSKYNFEVEIPAGVVNETASILTGKNKADEAIKLVILGLKLHPESVTLHGTLAELYEFTDQPVKARENYRKAFQKAKGNKALRLKYEALYQKLSTSTE